MNEPELETQASTALIIGDVDSDNLTELKNMKSLKHLGASAPAGYM